MNDRAGEVPYGMLNRAQGIGQGLGQGIERQGNSKPMPPERTADDLDVPRLLGHMNKGLAELHAAIEALGNRLEPAMSGAGPTQERTVQIGSSSEIGGRMAEVHSSIRAATERVGDFIARLQL